MTSQRKGFLTQKTARGLLTSLIASGAGILVIFVVYWVTLLLINIHLAFIPNAERRAAMFRLLDRQRRQGGKWTPRQGEHWIF